MRPLPLWLLLLLNALNVGAQTLPAALDDPSEPAHFERYGQSEGLSQGTIKQSVSYDGFMWFATLDGLNRFDGLTFKVFRKGGPGTLNNNVITALLADSKGMLWIGTEAGINLYDRRDAKIRTLEEVFGIRHLIGRVNIEHIDEDKAGGIWITTSDQGLFCLNLHTRKIEKYFVGSQIQATCIGADGQLWLAMNQGLFQFISSKNRFQHVEPQGWINMQAPVQAILFDQKGNLWVGTAGEGVLVINKKGALIHFKKGNPTNSLNCNAVTQLMTDRDGRIWISTRTGGISLYHPQTYQFTTIRHIPGDVTSLSQNFVGHIYQDYQGIIWIGTATQGINKYDPNRFRFGLIGQDKPNPDLDLPDRTVFALAGRDDTLYIATESGRLARRAFGSELISEFPQTLLSPTGVSNNDASALTADSKKTLWIANRHELRQYDPARGTTRFYPMPTGHAAVFSAQAMEDSSGQTQEIWVAGPGGLSRFDIQRKQWKSWEDLPELKSISKYSTRVIYQFTANRIWFGTLDHGLIGYDRKTRRLLKLQTDNYDFCPSIRSLRQIGQSLWAGTDCGLYRIELDQLRVQRYFSTATGLPSNVIHSIVPDDAGNLWVSSNAGITLFSPVLGVIKNYDFSDGLQSNEFSTNVAYKHSDGTLYFGGINGISYFRPDRLLSNTFVPPVRITGVSVLDSAYNPTQTQLSLGPDQNFIEISFAALNFSNTRKNKYMYQLIGIDPFWILAGNRRTANYTKLPPGEYTFRVKGSNDDGLWNEVGATLQITIHPPFWATLWFRTGLVVLLLVGSFGLYRFRLDQLKRQQVQRLSITIHTQELERQRFAKELHDGIGANLSVLKLYLTALGKPNTSADDIRSRSLEVLETSVSEVRSLVHDMHPRYLHEQGLTRSVANMIQLLNDSNQLCIAYLADELAETLPQPLEINLFRVVQELLQNAIKHAQASQIKLSIRTEAEKIQIEYSDNGRGFEVSRLNAGGGSGLANIRQRIELLEGTCHFISSPGEGTAVLISVPLTA